MPEPAPIRHIVLVGLMGAGKTTVGARVAARLGWSFRDSDAEITGQTGRTVRALRDEGGVDAMHALEARQLIDALTDPGPSVVAAAASVIDVAECRIALASAGVLVVWLRGSPDVLAERFGSQAHRPAYGADPATFLADQALRRDPLYAGLDPLIVDVDRIDPEAGVTEIERHVRALTITGRPPMTGPPG